MIDQNGFRENVGIVLVNSNRDVFWGRRAGTSFWQMPQGGIEKGETPKDAMLRELNEEVGLRPKHVEVIHRTNDWLHYRLPDSRVRTANGKKFIGQKQIWYLLKLVKSEAFIDINFFTYFIIILFTLTFLTIIFNIFIWRHQSPGFNFDIL